MSKYVLRSRWNRLSEQAIKEAQASQLRHYLRTVVLPFSARYRELFREKGLTADSIRTLSDLQRIPFTTKADFLDNPDRSRRFRDFTVIPEASVLARRPSTWLKTLRHGRKQVQEQFSSEFRPIFLTFTTGRAAEPIPFLYTQHDLTNLAIAGKRVMEICGARPEDRLLNAFPYSPHLAFWLGHYAGTAFGSLMLSSGGGKVLGTQGNLRLIRKFKPDALIGIPTFIYHLLRQAAEEGLRWENLGKIVLGGEKVSDGLRHKLHDLAGELGAKDVHLLATYGFTEAKMAWPECPTPLGVPPSGYHLYPDLGLFEVVDPKTGEPVPSGQPGELVFTPLDARGSVVLRYRTGDFLEGGMTYEPCPHCGRTMPRLLGRISRRSESKEMHFDKIKGTLVDFNQLECVLDDAPHVGAWQVELRKIHDDPLELDELILHVHNRDRTNEQELARELRDRFFAHTELHPNRIVFHEAEEMERLQGVGVLLKEQKIADHRPSLTDLAKPRLSSNGNGNGAPAVVTVSGKTLDEPKLSPSS